MIKNILNIFVTNPIILSNNELKNFKNDFFDFYGPVTEDINRKLFFQGYFNNLIQKYHLEKFELEDVQELIQKYNKIVDEKGKEKEAELMSI